MASATAARKTAAPTSTTAGQSLVLTGIRWETYRKLGEALSEHHVRMTYDQGALEIMLLSFRHENLDYLLARLVDTLTEELSLPVEGGGSTTFQSHALERGLEPDACWWIANAARVSGKNDIDLTVDPPPDLVLEVDVTHSSLDRMAIYAAMQVPEVWRLDGTRVTFHVLRKGRKKYTETATSRTFPRLAAQDVQTFLDQRGQKDVNAIVRQFRAWVRKNLATGK